MTTAPATLEAHGVSVSFNGVTALQDVDLTLSPRETLAMIGPNGAGKTTLVNVLSGYQRPTAGHVMLAGNDVTPRLPHERVRMGLARTFQSGRLFPKLTVLDNVLVAAMSCGRDRVDTDTAAALLESVGLLDRAHEEARSLSYGAERRLGIVRSLACSPRFLLLDEPAAGLNDREAESLIEYLRGVPAQHDTAILLIEHDMRVVMALSERIHVLDHGQTLAIGTPAEIRANREVQRAYFGRAVESNHA